MTNTEFSYDYYVDPFDEIFDKYDIDPELLGLDESSYLERAKNEIFKIEVIDVDKYIDRNECKPITNPTFFASTGLPTNDGLLSNEIFGITQADRSGIFAYIDLQDYFIDPSCYKTLTRLEPSKMQYIINGMKTYKITDSGELVEDPDGNTGLRWFRKNFGKIKFKKTDSRARDMRIRYVEHNYKLGRLFINKCIVIPAYYRDVNTTGKHTGVGQINTLYVNLITAANAMKENADYGLSMANTTCFRIQDTLKTIYDWYCGNSNDAIKDKGSGLGGKFGLIRANMSYTSDYSSRLVITAPELKVNSVDDLMVSLDKSAMPLAAVTADFYPFMLYHMRKFFENEFLNVTNYQVTDRDGNLVNVELESPLIAFSDDVLKDNLKKFVYSYDNRFVPIELPTTDKTEKYYMTFKANRWDTINDVVQETEPTFNRPLTWTDVIFICACKSVEDKKIIINRYPFDGYFNTIYTGVEVASTLETEPLVVNGEYYKFYPKIRLKDIGKGTMMKFVDSMQISNLYLAGMGGDYDGDTVIVKGAFFKETNDELSGFVNKKTNFINMSGSNIRVSEKEAVQAIYNLTLILRDDKQNVGSPEF